MNMIEKKSRSEERQMLYEFLHYRRRGEKNRTQLHRCGCKRGAEARMTGLDPYRHMLRVLL